MALTVLENRTHELLQSTCTKITEFLRRQSQPKQIDWEQRRYEIAREILSHYPAMEAVEAVSLADKLIEELKK